MLMNSRIRIVGRWAPLLAALLGCERPPFSAPGACDSCPPPPTKPPVVHFVSPLNGGQIDRSSLLTVSATDDKQVTGVEFYRAAGDPTNNDWIKLHPGQITAAPWVLDLSRYQDSLPTSIDFIYLHAIAHDIEGNADTDVVFVKFNWTPP